MLDRPFVIPKENTMTVKELIAKLQEFNQLATVLYYDEDFYTVDAVSAVPQDELKTMIDEDNGAGGVMLS
jgi:hypothetical protein